MTDLFFYPCDSRLLQMRKSGYSATELFNTFQESQPLASNYLGAIHILTLCSEHGLGFSKPEISRFANPLYYTDMGGDKKEKGYFMTRKVFLMDCLKHSGKYKIKFKKAQTPKPTPKKLPHSLVETSLICPINNDNFQTSITDSGVKND